MNKIRDAEPIHYSNLEEGKEYILKGRAEGLVKLISAASLPWTFEILDGSVFIAGVPKRKPAQFVMYLQQLQAVKFYERV